MRRLDRYIARNFVFGLLPTLLLLTGLFSFLALVQELEDVGKGSYSTLSALAVIALTLPRKLIDILPVVALLGALTGLGGMPIIARSWPAGHPACPPPEWPRRWR